MKTRHRRERIEDKEYNDPKVRPSPSTRLAAARALTLSPLPLALLSPRSLSLALSPSSPPHHPQPHSRSHLPLAHRAPRRHAQASPEMKHLNRRFAVLHSVASLLNLAFISAAATHAAYLAAFPPA